MEINNESHWKEQDYEPTIPPFTNNSQVQTELSDNLKPLDFFSLYFDEGF